MKFFGQCPGLQQGGSQSLGLELVLDIYAGLSRMIISASVLAGTCVSPMLAPVMLLLVAAGGVAASVGDEPDQHIERNLYSLLLSQDVQSICLWCSFVFT